MRRDRQGRLNLANLVEPDKANDDPLPWFEIKETKLEHIALLVHDDFVPHRFASTLMLDQISAHNIGSEKGHSGKIALSATGPGAANLKATADLVLQPLSVQGNVVLTALPIKPFAPYYDQVLAIQISQGTLGATTHFNVAQGAEKKPELVITLSALSVQLANLKARQPGDKNDLLQLGALDLKAGALDLGKQRISIGEVALKGLSRPIEVFNISRLVA